MAAPEVSLRDYVEQQFKDLREYIDTRFRLNHQMTVQAQDALEHRLDSLNELRALLNDQQGKFVSREVLDGQIKDLITRLDGMAERINKTEQRAAALDGRILGASAVVTFLLMAMEGILHF